MLHDLYFSTIFISLFLHKSSLRQACRAAGPESGAARKSPVDAVFVRNALGYRGLCRRYDCIVEKVARCGLTGGPVAWRGLYGIPRHPVRPCRAIGCKQKGRPWQDAARSPAPCVSATPSTGFCPPAHVAGGLEGQIITQPLCRISFFSYFRNRKPDLKSFMAYEHIQQ